MVWEHTKCKGWCYLPSITTPYPLYFSHGLLNMININPFLAHFLSYFENYFATVNLSFCHLPFPGITKRRGPFLRPSGGHPGRPNRHLNILNFPTHLFHFITLQSWCMNYYVVCERVCRRYTSDKESPNLLNPAGREAENWKSEKCIS